MRETEMRQFAYGARHHDVDVYGFPSEITSTDAVVGKFRVRQDRYRDADDYRRSTATGRPRRDAVPRTGHLGRLRRAY